MLIFAPSSINPSDFLWKDLWLNSCDILDHSKPESFLDSDLGSFGVSVCPLFILFTLSLFSPFPLSSHPRPSQTMMIVLDSISEKKKTKPFREKLQEEFEEESRGSVKAIHSATYWQSALLHTSEMIILIFNIQGDFGLEVFALLRGMWWIIYIIL